MLSNCFAVVGDLQETSRLEFWREDNAAERALLIEHIARAKPSFVVLLGDLVFDGSSEAQWRRFDAVLAPLRDAGIPVVPILGNHDYGWGAQKDLRHYDARFPELAGHRWHRRRFESLELVFLDSNQPALGGPAWDAQTDWFAGALGEANRDPLCRGTLVFVHHPPLTNSSLTRDSAAVRRFFLRPFLQSTKTRAMMSGHVHSYERFEEGGKTFVVSGGGGGPRVRLLGERRCRHRDLYRGVPGAKRPCHYLSIGVEPSALSVRVLGIAKGQGSVTPLETFDLALS